MKSVLSWSSGVGMSRPHFILRSKARWRTVSSSSFVHSCVLIKSRPRRSVFIFILSFLCCKLWQATRKGVPAEVVTSGHVPPRPGHPQEVAPEAVTSGHVRLRAGHPPRPPARGGPLRRQLKHLNNRIERRDQAGESTGPEIGSDAALHAKDAGACAQRADAVPGPERAGAEGCSSPR